MARRNFTRQPKAEAAKGLARPFRLLDSYAEVAALLVLVEANTTTVEVRPCSAAPVLVATATKDEALHVLQARGQPLDCCFRAVIPAGSQVRCALARAKLLVPVGLANDVTVAQGTLVITKLVLTVAHAMGTKHSADFA